MANLLDLPNELLSEIIDHQLERSRLWELARMNHRLHALTQPLLFRHATGLSSRQILLLKRTLKEKQSLQKAIWSYGPIDTETDGYVSLEDFYDIPGFVNLKKLQFRVVKFLPGPHQSHQSLFRWDILGQIEEIELAACESPRVQSPAMLIALFSRLPLVHTLTVTDILMGLAPWSMPLHADRWVENQSSSTYPTLPGITTLKLNGFENSVIKRSCRPSGVGFFNSKTIATILQPCTNLTTFHCTNLLLFDRSDGPWKTYIYCSELQNALSHIKGSLRELVLTVGSDEDTLFHAKPLDLSALTGLKRLHISSVFLGWNGVFPGDRAEDKRGLHKRLPPNVETLRIDFNPPLGIFRAFDDPVYDEHAHLLRWRWEWLLLFPTFKTSYFPRLREVKMVEAKPISNHSLVKWDIPQDLAELSEKADIGIDIWIRKHEVKKPDWISMTKFIRIG